MSYRDTIWSDVFVGKSLSSYSVRHGTKSVYYIEGAHLLCPYIVLCMWRVPCRLSSSCTLSVADISGVCMSEHSVQDVWSAGRWSYAIPHCSHVKRQASSHSSYECGPSCVRCASRINRNMNMMLDGMQNKMEPITGHLPPSVTSLVVATEVKITHSR